MRLREEQDAAYRAALEADQVCRFLTLFISSPWFSYFSFSSDITSPFLVPGLFFLSK